MTLLSDTAAARWRELLDTDQPILDRVACELGVPEHEAGDLVQPHDGRTGERGEGVVIAPPCCLDEPSLVHDHPSVRGTTSVMPSDESTPDPVESVLDGTNVAWARSSRCVG